jgi:predicted unusual protein kinase regulating ubiquinone biosynthesis (AarF/ABC1/UbiB family)
MGFAELAQVDPREFRDFAIQFGDVVRSLPFQLPENFLLIIRASSLTSGVCSALNPAFNLWDSVEPYAAGLMRDERGNIAQAFGKEAADVARIAARLPRRLDDLVTRLDDGRVAVDTPRLDRRIARLEAVTRRVVSSVLFAGLFIGGAVLHTQAPVLGVVLIAVSAVPLLHAAFGGLAGRGRG